MSGLKSTSDVTTKLDFDQLIVEMCANDVRTATGVTNIKNIFQNNVQLFNEYDEEMKLILSFQKVQIYFNAVIGSFNELFKKAVNIDERTKNNFFEVLPLISRQCTTINGNVIHISAATLKPFCKCDFYLCEDVNHHLLYECDLKGNGGIGPEKKNQILIEKIIGRTGYIFKDKVINGLKPFQNPDVGILLGSEVMISHENQLINLNSAAEVFYNNLAEIFKNKTYEHFTDDEKRDFHFRFVELISLKANNEILNTVQSFLKDNGTKLGMYYYIRLMHKLVMAGWYGIDEFHKEIQEIASLETIWVNDIEEKPNVKAIFNKLLFFSCINNINDKENILKDLKKLREYIKITDFNSLMKIFNDELIYRYDLVHLIDSFYSILKKIYDDTLKNGFKPTPE